MAVAGKAGTDLPVNGLSANPATRVIGVTPADADLPGGMCRSLLVGGAGLANIMDAEGNIVTGVPLVAGYNPIAVRQVRASTAATSIFALY